MQINTKQLRSALSACSQAADRRITLPILSCAKLEAKAGRLTIQSSNLDVWVERHLDCEGDLEPCAVNLKLLQQVTDQVQAESCDLLMAGKLIVTDSASKSVSRLNVVPAVEFPPWPTGKLVPTAVNCADLATGLDAVAWSCIDADEGRLNLENVLVALSAQKIVCAGANGKSLAVFSKASIAADAEFQVPQAFVPALIEALEQPHSLIAIGENMVECSHESGRTMVKLSDLKFVNYAEIMAKKGGDLARIKTDDLKRPCAACLNYHSERRYPQLDLDWKGDIITATINGDIAESVQEIACVGKRKSGVAYLNAKYLSAALGKMGDEVKFTPCDSVSFWESGDLCVGILQLRAKEKA